VNRIRKIKEIHPVEEGVVELSVFCNEKEDIREEVFRVLVNAGITILEMQSLRMSLEDIFLKVTNKETPTPIAQNVTPYDEDEESDQDNIQDEAKAEEGMRNQEEEVSSDAGNI
jgi:ABC-2 type transport system ATP-binding protein